MFRDQSSVREQPEVAVIGVNNPLMYSWKGFLARYRGA